MYIRCTQFIFLSHEAEYFRGQFLDNNQNIKINSATPAQVREYYKSCKYGFILRDEHVLNKVACPTKLIEYLYYGIIPVVKYPGIGNFQANNYSYILLDDLNNNILPSEQELETMRQNNWNILQNMTSEVLESLDFLKDI